MSADSSATDIRPLLEKDRWWTAYALADLDPIYAEGAHWLVQGDAVILHYQALKPPVLFLHGPQESIQLLMPRIPAGPVQFMVREELRHALLRRLTIASELEMWRMALDPIKFERKEPPDYCRQLEPDDLGAIDSLIQGQPDQPDAFSRSQLEHGVFYGCWQDETLVAMAGTHVLSTLMDVAALGNVFTHPDYRGHGYGRVVSGAVLADLLDQGIGTIVLNVAQHNQAALKIYRDLGFWPVCGYHEGVGTIRP